MVKLIEPRILKGFRDSLPYGAQGEKRRHQIIETLGQVFELSGFDPIDTPALELCEALLGKAGDETEKQIYRFKDNGGRDVALRFDLTVPFARFVVQHAAELDFPFKRYHIAKVWRGENAQRGRYREFYQCDFDIVGDSSILADLCILQTLHNAFEQLQSDYPVLGGLRIHLNHQGLLEAFWQLCDVSSKEGEGEDMRIAALRCIDKLHKVGRPAVYAELETLLQPLTKSLPKALGLKIIQTLLALLDLGKLGNEAGSLSQQPQPGLQGLEQLFWNLMEEAAKYLNPALPLAASQTLNSALAELRPILDFATANFAHSNIQLHFDPTIARGLDYYTGMVFETFLEQLPALGSVCSGGRYDQLTQLYSKKPMPGVGASIGLDRLLAALEQLEKAALEKQEGTAQNSEHDGALIICPDPQWQGEELDAPHTVYGACLQFSQQLQQLGLPCDVVPRPAKMNALFRRAKAKNSNYLLLLKPNSSWQLRNLESRQSAAVTSASEVFQQLTGIECKPLEQNN